MNWGDGQKSSIKIIGKKYENWNGGKKLSYYFNFAISLQRTQVTHSQSSITAAKNTSSPPLHSPIAQFSGNTWEPTSLPIYLHICHRSNYKNKGLVLWCSCLSVEYKCTWITGGRNGGCSGSVLENLWRVESLGSVHSLPWWVS